MVRQILLGLIAASVLGCGSSGTKIAGTVSVNDQPLRCGYITFYPVEGTKGMKGASVTDGVFTITDLPPGQWKALISGTPDVQLAQNRNGPNTLRIAPSKQAVTPTTKGNQTIVEIRPGKQALEFALQTP